MAKAKLTTRAISSTTVTSDNLAKGSQLTHNQLDSNFINLRDQSFGIAADDSATIQVGAGDTLYIQGGTNVTTSTDSAGVVTINASTSGDSLGDLTAVGSTLSSPSNAAITLDPSGTGTIELNADTNITGAATVSGAITGSSIKVGSRSDSATTGNTDDPTAGLFIGDPYTGIGDSTQVFVGQNDTPWMQQMGIDGLASNSQPMDANVIHNQVDDGHTYISTTGDGQVVIPRVKLGWPLSGITVNGTGTSPQVTIGSLANEGNMLATINAGTIDVYTRIRTNEEQFPDSAGTYDGHGLQIQQNEIFSWASNDDVKIHANGSGRVHLENLTIADDGAVVTGIKDEDDMSSNSNVKLATQQSIKAYVDASVSGIGGDITSVVAGTGLTGGGTTSDVTLNVIGGTGITANANDIAIDSTVATLTGSQTLTNKVLTAPTINAATMTGNVTVDNLIFNDNIISSDSNADIRLEPGGTGKITSTGVLSLTDDTSTSPNLLIAGGGSTGDFTLKLGNHPSRANQGNSIYADGSALYLESSTNSIILQNSALTIAADRGITFESTAGGSGDGTIKNLNLDIINNTISSKQSNEDIELDPNGSGVVNVKSSKITNVTDPGAAQDAATKAYVDANVLSLIDEDNMSTNSATRPPSQQSVKAYVDAEVSGAGGGGLKVIGDDSAGVDIAGGGTLYVQGGTNVTTATDSAGVLTINASASGDVTGSSTTTFTNKTIDANGTGNNISNIDIGNMTAASVVLEAEGIASNDNDTTLPTSAAVKDYADTKAVLSGSTNNQVATVTGAHALTGESGLTYDGSTLAVSGAATVSTTLGVTGDATLDGIIIHDNSIKTANSNANLDLGTNGTGRIELTTDDSSIFESTKYTDFFGSTSNIRGVVINTNQEVNPATTSRNYQNVINQDTKLITASSSSNSNFRQRTMLVTNTTDMNGFSYTRSGFSRGPVALTFGSTAMNTGGSASTLKTLRGFDSQAGVYISTASNLASDVTINDVYGANSTIYAADDDGGASGSAIIDDAYNYRASYYKTSGDTITNIYAFYNEGAEDSAATNRYAFYSLDAGASSRMGAIRLDNQSGDPTNGSDFSWIYAKDDSGSSEVHVRDEAGNVTKISPHNTEGEWEYYSVNKHTGKTVRVNMERMIKKLEEYTGESFIENE